MSVNEDLNHAEIWDDSELVDTWEEALQEYKYYHSLHARGEKIEEVLLRAEIEDNNSQGQELTAVAEELIEEGEIGTAESIESSATAATVTKDPSHTADESGQDGLHMPQAVLSVGQDESLKSLMMSWYYAGYYTGFYEGQQQSHQPSAATQKKGNST